MANIYCIKYLATSAKKFDYIIQLVQPKEFETDPEFLQLCQNLTTDFFCWFANDCDLFEKILVISLMIQWGFMLFPKIL